MKWEGHVKLSSWDMECKLQLLPIDILWICIYAIENKSISLDKHNGINGKIVDAVDIYLVDGVNSGEVTWSNIIWDHVSILPSAALITIGMITGYYWPAATCMLAASEQEDAQEPREEQQWWRRGVILQSA